MCKIHFRHFKAAKQRQQDVETEKNNYYFYLDDILLYKRSLIILAFQRVLQTMQKDKFKNKNGFTQMTKCTLFCKI